MFQVPENDEGFQLELTSATQGARVINTNFTIIISANDAPIRFQKVGLIIKFCAVVVLHCKLC